MKKPTINTVDDVKEHLGEIDFTADLRSPMLMVPCPSCKAGQGSLCKRPSGHDTSDFHKARRTLADDVFIAQHGEDAEIYRVAGKGSPFEIRIPA